MIAWLETLLCVAALVSVAALMRRIGDLEVRMGLAVTKQEFDTALAAYFDRVTALVTKLTGHPAAPDFSEEMQMLLTAQTNLAALAGADGSSGSGSTGTDAGTGSTPTTTTTDGSGTEAGSIT
jgi:hypothetical protein